MRVHLCRHAEAVAVDPGEPDELRELTSAGRYGAKVLADRLASLDEPPRNVVTSPLTRAVQTAEPVAELLGCEVLVRDELAPGATVDSLRTAVEGLEGPVAAVCHAPWMLAEAGIARGRTVTSWPSIKTDLVNAGANWVDRTVVEDGNLITSRKPDDLEAFSDAIIRHLDRAPATREPVAARDRR